MRYHIEYSKKNENDPEDYDVWTIVESTVDVPVNIIDDIAFTCSDDVLLMVDVEKLSIPEAFVEVHKLIMDYINRKPTYKIIEVFKDVSFLEKNQPDSHIEFNDFDPVNFAMWTDINLSHCIDFLQSVINKHGDLRGEYDSLQGILDALKQGQKYTMLFRKHLG